MFLKLKESIEPGWIREQDTWTMPKPAGSVGFTPWGFDRTNDQALDMMGWAGFDLQIKLSIAAMVCIHAGFADGQSAMHAIPLSAGQHHFFLSLRDFHMPQSKANVWRFLQTLTIQNAEAERIVAVRSRGLWVDCDRRGRSAEAGGAAVYEARVYNCQEHPVIVLAAQACYGWEGFPVTIEPETFTVQPGEAIPVRFSVSVP